jgi:hypothetical protein
VGDVVGDVIARLQHFIDEEFVPGPVPPPKSEEELKEIAHMKRWSLSKKLTTLSEASSDSARLEGQNEFTHQTIKRSATARKSLAPVDLEVVEGPLVSPSTPQESPQPSKVQEFCTPHLTRLGECSRTASSGMLVVLEKLQRTAQIRSPPRPAPLAALLMADFARQSMMKQRQNSYNAQTQTTKKLI